MVEFKPDGSFVEYNSNIPKHSKEKVTYALYNDELNFVINEGKETITMRFRVRKELYGLYLQLIDIGQKKNTDVLWVKLFPWKPK